MANPEHLVILKQGVVVWNKWRNQNPEIIPNLSGAYLGRLNLKGAIVHRTEFERANLSGSDLGGTVLNFSNLSYANLHRANLSSAALLQTNLNSANLDETIFHGAQFGFTSFGNLDLSQARNLEFALHFAPSTVGIDTIYLSNGRIPEVFLRGCGVPDEIIELNRSLSEKSSPYYRCFISHSGKDKRFCERLYADLQAKGVRVWYFPEDAKWGEPVWGEIDRSIRIYDKLIVVCSKNSLTSGPVLREIDRALNREDKEGKNVLFPITIDDYIFDEWEHPRKADILAKVVGDFRGWNRSTAEYDAAFKKLLKALKAE